MTKQEAEWMKKELERALSTQHYHKNSTQFNAIKKTARMMKLIIMYNNLKEKNNKKEGEC